MAVPGDDEEASDLIVHIGGLDNFRSAFGSDTAFFSGKDWYVSATNGGGSSAQTFEGGDYRFLHLALEMQAGDAVLEWARSVIEDFPGLPTIISTHDFLNPRGERQTGRRMDLALADPGFNNSAEDIWLEFIRETDQVFLVLSGHQPGQAYRVDKNRFGHDVHQVLADFQRRSQAGVDAGEPVGQGLGDGWLREMTFRLDAENPRIEVRTYSPHYGAYASDLPTYAEWYRETEQPDMTDEEFVAADEFTVTLNGWRARFGVPTN